jgi:hypothetical protein
MTARAARASMWTSIAWSFAIAASAEEPFSFDAAPGRLPKDAVPVSYSITVVPDASALTLSGSELVQLQLRSATARLQFNSKNETLHDVRLDGTPVKDVVTDDDQQPAPIGRHTLTFSYRGKIETRRHGLFAQHYSKPDGGQGCSERDVGQRRAWHGDGALQAVREGSVGSGGRYLCRLAAATHGALCHRVTGAPRVVCATRACAA